MLTLIPSLAELLWCNLRQFGGTLSSAVPGSRMAVPRNVLLLSRPHRLTLFEKLPLSTSAILFWKSLVLSDLLLRQSGFGCFGFCFFLRSCVWSPFSAVFPGLQVLLGASRFQAPSPQPAEMFFKVDMQQIANLISENCSPLAFEFPFRFKKKNILNTIVIQFYSLCAYWL